MRLRRPPAGRIIRCNLDPRPGGALVIIGHRAGDNVEHRGACVGVDRRGVDVSVWLDGLVFEPLRDPAHFSTFFLDGGAVPWPNGAYVAPETLDECQGVAGEAA